MTTIELQRFAMIDLNSGYVWHVCDAESAAAACSIAVADTGGDHGVKFREITRSEINTTAGGFAVHLAPAGYDCDDGQDAAQIAAVGAMPRVGYFRAVDC